MRCFLVSVLRNDYMNRQIFPFFCNNHKKPSHLELNFKRWRIVMNVRFENWGIKFGWCSRIIPSFSLGTFTWCALMFIFFSEGNGNDFLVRSVFSYLCSMSRERLSRKRRNKEMNILCDVLGCNIAEYF